MHAIILAAGQGERPAGKAPGCLAEIGGRSLLARHLDLLFRFGVQTADMVVGYGASQVIDHVGTLSSRPDVAYHFNPRYELGSVMSLWAAGETLSSGADVLLMDAELLYHPSILQRLIESTAENCFLLDRERGPAPGAVKFALHDGRIVDMGRQLPAEPEYDGIGVSAGMCRFGARAAECIADECARFEAEGLGDSPYEEVLRNVLLSCPLAFACEDIAGLPWAAVTAPEDFERAEREILPAIRDDIPGF